MKDKSGDQSSLDNYGPITLSSVISKLFEMYLLELFSNFMETDQLQFGFKKKSCCSNALFVLRQLSNYYNERSINIYIASLDAAKAFDRVNHCTLFFILLKKGFPVYLVDLINNWYLKLSLTDRWNGFNSDFLRVRSGARQGGVLSPTLFNLYVDCIIKTLRNDGSGCHYMNSYVGCIMYADDLPLISTCISNLQCMLNLCGSEGNKLGINFNYKKSHCMTIGPQYTVNVSPIEINGMSLSWVNKLSYPGVVIYPEKLLMLTFLVHDVNSFLLLIQF